jgi:hypothetical protein
MEEVAYLFKQLFRYCVRTVVLEHNMPIINVLDDID